MSSVLDRSELEQSPLADLHLLANELGVDGFRRPRREELIHAIVARQSRGAAPRRRPAGRARRARRPRQSADDAPAAEPAPETGHPAEPAEPAEEAEPA